jgi:hypothetical protein
MRLWPEDVREAPIQAGNSKPHAHRFRLAALWLTYTTNPTR